jgi:hypothetical protein
VSDSFFFADCSNVIEELRGSLKLGSHKAVGHQRLGLLHLSRPKSLSAFY